MNKLLILLTRMMLACVMLTFLFNFINREDEPLQIEPMYADFSSWDDENHVNCRYNRRIEDFYYLRNFNDDKEDLKHIVKFLKDSIDNNERHIKLCESDCAYYDDGAAYYYGDAFIIELEKVNNPNTLFHDFETFSKYSRYKDYELYPPYPRNYNYDIEYYGSSALLTFKYYKLNSDILQKFLNVVYQKRVQLWYDYKDDPTFTIPSTYYLFNGKGNKVEVAISYPHEYKNYFNITIY